MIDPTASPQTFEGFSVGDEVVAVHRDSYGRVTRTHRGVVVAINEKTRRVSISAPTFAKAKRRAYSIDAYNVAPADRATEWLN